MSSSDSSDHMGGPEMAPQPPQRSGRPGEAVAPLDTAGGGVANAERPAPQRSDARRRVPSRRSHTGLVASGVVIILAGFAIALGEMLRLQKGSVWVIVAVTAAIVGAIRAITRRR